MAIYKIGNKLLSNGAGKMFGFPDPEPPPQGVEIGGRFYKTVTIGNQEWLAENLDYKFCNIGGPIGSTANAWYYDDDETTYGIDGLKKCGLLYNWVAVKYLEDNKNTLLPEGWRVPTYDDLYNFYSITNYNAKKLKAKNNSILENWPSNWNGTDEFGFCMLPTGSCDQNKNFTEIGTKGYLWSITQGSEIYYAQVIYFDSNNVIEHCPCDKWKPLSLRLVKDL